MGIDGFWNDMNEPAIFYSVKGLNKALDKAASLKGQNLDLSKFFELRIHSQVFQTVPRIIQAFTIQLTANRFAMIRFTTFTVLI